MPLAKENTAARRSRVGLVPNPKSRLREQVREVTRGWLDRFPQRRRRAIFVEPQSKKQIQPRRGGISRTFADDVAPTELYPFFESSIYNDVSPTGFPIHRSLSISASPLISANRREGFRDRRRARGRLPD